MQCRARIEYSGASTDILSHLRTVTLRTACIRALLAYAPSLGSPRAVNGTGARLQWTIDGRNQCMSRLLQGRGGGLDISQTALQTSLTRPAISMCSVHESPSLANSHHLRSCQYTTVLVIWKHQQAADVKRNVAWKYFSTSDVFLDAQRCCAYHNHVVAPQIMLFSCLLDPPSPCLPRYASRFVRDWDARQPLPRECCYGWHDPIGTPAFSSIIFQS